MMRSPHFRRLGTVVLVVSFVVATCHVTAVRLRQHSRTTLRFAHWQLEGGIRQAFDVLARDYEKLHPEIRVEQMLIPESIYRSWGTTQMIGGAAPDLVQNGRGMGGPEVFSYFLTLTEEVDQPNPYNAGTPLAGVPWRNTYVDGMTGAYHRQTFECYGASIFASSTRIYYNVGLMREITGKNETPRTFEELMALCAQVRAFAAQTGRDVLPFASSRTYGTVMFDDLVSGQIQRLACEMNPGIRFPADDTEFYLSYLNRRWTLDHPGMRGGVELMQQVCREMPPGFLQFGREDAQFYFVQGRALMMLAFSQDATGIKQQVDFPIAVFRNPMPQPSPTGLGANLVGRNSEGVLNIYGAFGIARSSPHPELALDFLRFISSQAEDRKFARISGSLPVIVGIAPEGFTQNFSPDLHGFPPGPSLFSGPIGQVFSKHLHLLAGPAASCPDYLHAVGEELGETMRTQLELGARGLRRTVALNDITIEATRRLMPNSAPTATALRKYQGLVETQNEQEATAYYIDLRLRQAERAR